MAASSTVLREADVPRQQLSALKRKAKRMGLSPAAYIQQLIEDDLALDRKARSTPLDKLAAPFRKALKNVPDDELDRLVDAARTRHAARSARRGRRS